ncbi:Wd-40 repeat protein [Mycena venus]|uniref:Wd-40 repeat protein n=1 Tax=Mycena venus TaxID=2733690 RepID=A0A8H6XIZ2_9AGAR|nr:Wd-40 repeat protein [Mycena venus]
MPTATCMSSEEFFATWKHSVSADFERDGVPANTGPWVTEVTKMSMNAEARVVALSDDNSLFAAAVGHEIHVYDLPTSQLVHTLQGHIGYKIENIEFQPSGRKIATDSSRMIPQKRVRQSLVRVWDLDALPKSLDNLGDAVEAAVTAASSTLSQNWSAEDLESANLQTEFAEIIAGGQAAVDLRNGRVVLGNLPSFESRAFSHDGRSLLYLPDRDSVAILDVDTNKERFRLSGHTGAVVWAETSPDDKVVATTSWGKTVRIWSMETGELIRLLEGATNQNWSGAFSPDGELIAAGAGDKMVRIWRVSTGELLHTLSGYTRWIRSLSFSPDGLHLAAGAAAGTLRVFDVRSGECEQSWQIDLEGPFAHSFLEVSRVQYTPRAVTSFSARPRGGCLGTGHQRI